MAALALALALVFLTASDVLGRPAEIPKHLVFCDGDQAAEVSFTPEKKCLETTSLPWPRAFSFNCPPPSHGGAAAATTFTLETTETSFRLPPSFEGLDFRRVVEAYEDLDCRDEDLYHSETSVASFVAAGLVFASFVVGLVVFYIARVMREPNRRRRGPVRIVLIGTPAPVGTVGSTSVV